MTILPKVKLKAVVSFPATVLDGTGIDVVKSNGNFQFNLDFGDFAPPVSSVPDPAHQNVLLWDSITGSYSLVPASVLVGASGLPDAPNDGVQYGRQSLAWTAIPIGAPLASPVFTGDPKAPTPAPGDNDTSIATTAFVAAAITSSGGVTPSALTRVNDTNITLTLGGTPATALLQATSITVGWAGTLGAARGGFGADVSAQSGVPLFAAGVATFTGSTGTGNFARAASPVFTGDPQAPTPAVDDNDTSLATTAYVIGQASAVADGTPAMDGAAARGVAIHWARADHIHPSDTSRAPLASPALTGTPTAPTAAPATNTTQIATTAYADAIAALKANLASPALTGTPTAPTAAANDNSTKLATTAYADAIAALKANIASPALTGVPTAPTAAPSTSTTQLATTAFVGANPVTHLQLNGGSGASSTTFWRGDDTWAVPAGGGGGSGLNDFRNALFANGGLQVWQRGAGGAASFAVAASTVAYTADRWFLATGALQASVVSQQPGLTNQSRWAARVLRNAGQTGTTVMRFEYPLTTEEVVVLRGQQISFQAVLKAGANWSPASGTLNINAYFGTGAEAKRNATAYTGETNPLTTSVNLTPGGAAAQTTFTGAGTVATNVTQGCLQFSWTPVGTAGAADSFDIDDVQLEVGTTATAFERPTIGISLRECQRHYCKTFNYQTAPAQNAGLTNAAFGACGGASSTVLGDIVYWKFPVSMRAIPTVTTYNPVAANAQIRELSGTAGDASSTAASSIGTEMAAITGSTNAGGATTGSCAVCAQADAGI